MQPFELISWFPSTVRRLQLQKIGVGRLPVAAGAFTASTKINLMFRADPSDRPIALYRPRRSRGKRCGATDVARFAERAGQRAFHRSVTELRVPNRVTAALQLSLIIPRRGPSLRHLAEIELPRHRPLPRERKISRQIGRRF